MGEENLSRTGGGQTRMSKLFLLALLVVGALVWMGYRTRRPEPSSTVFDYVLTDAQWKAKLSPESYRVLRHEATERPNTSALNHEKREGEFVCAGCGSSLFLSAGKFDSGTGWPSFTRPAKVEAVGTRTDVKLVIPRTEVHCARCGGHLGHVFNDGPAPTGKRYCINGAALDFRASEPSDSKS